RARNNKKACSPGGRSTGRQSSETARKKKPGFSPDGGSTGLQSGETARKNKKGFSPGISLAPITQSPDHSIAGGSWYILPAHMVAGRAGALISATSTRSRFAPYREAWHLLKQF